MIWLYVYLSGYVVSLIVFTILFMTYEKEKQITVKDACYIIMIAAFSWLFLIIAIVIGIDHLRDSIDFNKIGEIVIWRKK